MSSPPSSPLSPSLHVAIVAPEIPWNPGRTCLAVGARLHLIEPLGFSLAEREIRRAGLDYWARVSPSVWPDWATFEARLPELGTPFFFAPRARSNFREVAYPERT